MGERELGARCEESRDARDRSDVDGLRWCGDWTALPV